ncbi:hypothetical protein D8M34_03735 [Microbacterium sp. HSID17254]|uniref:hypothetical protein n=1 Tax=Microbacterium sp. HSID17254 TaxID=2419509 RepID=UPI000F880737|nr:hypothetical protein [Microbacterium sp. HSID17254]RUQ07492.1 hypothetical protein D8M34_03735 [Microbacterium sp. HSID17254]
MFHSIRVACHGRPDRSQMIMRLISIIGLTLLLIFAVGAAEHGSADVTKASTTASTSLDADESGADAAAAEPAGVVMQLATGAAQVDPVTGAVLCVLGLLCGLVAAVMLYRLLWRTTAVVVETHAAQPRTSAAPNSIPLRRTSLTLATLGISRT